MESNAVIGDIAKSQRKMIPLAVPNLAGHEARYLQECIDSTFVSSVGPFVAQFEQAVALASGAGSAVATNAGTTALHAALVTVGVGRDDIVIVPSLTFIATVSAIHWTGAEPWFVEVSPESWTIDCGRLEALLARETEIGPTGTIHCATGRRVTAILPVYTLGNPADMDRIVRLAEQYKLVIVADAAAALGASYKSRPLADFGAALSMISFNGNKTVTAGGGGAIIGNDAYIQRARHLVSTARLGTDYLHDAIGFNYRMTNLQAGVGCAQMELFTGFLARKREIRRYYDEAFDDLPGVTLFPSPEWGESACWFSGVVVENCTEGRMRSIIAMLRANSVDARPFWRPMHLQPPLVNALADDLSFTESIWARVLTLPCSTHLSRVDQDYVIETVRKTVESA